MFGEDNQAMRIQAVTDEIKNDLNIISEDVKRKIAAYTIDDTIETCNTDAETADLNATSVSKIDPTTENIILELNKEIIEKARIISELKFKKIRNSNKFNDILPQLIGVVDEIKNTHDAIYTKNAEMTNLIYTANNSIIKLEELHSKMSRNMRWASGKCNRGGKRQRKTRRRKTQRRRM